MAETNDSYLFQNPNYCLDNTTWSRDYLDLLKTGSSFTWDPAAFLSYISYGYVCGDRTLVQEIRRQPWMSKVNENGVVDLAKVPPHGFKKRTPENFGDKLVELLENEAEHACRGKANIFILTSGGLDSRIVSGIVKRLKDQNRISADIHAVSWGRNGSRDVEFGKVVAQNLGFRWEQRQLSKEHLLENIEAAADYLGSLVSPIHLHRMGWFRSLGSNDLVLAGSYGDSVGRAEFSGRTILELVPYKFIDQYNLLQPEIVESGQSTIAIDMASHRERFSDRPEYAIRECEQQSHYMRGMIAQAMSMISDQCSVYQMFTEPKLLAYVWQTHPSYRTDKPYARVLDKLGNGLDRIPWARTNRPLKGGAGVKIAATSKQYHEYPNWLESLLEQKDLESHTDWLSNTGIFRAESISNVVKLLDRSSLPSQRQFASSFLSWSFSLKRFADYAKPSLPNLPACSKEASPADSKPAVSSIRKNLREIPIFRTAARKTRKWLVQKQAIWKFPPE